MPVAYDPEHIAAFFDAYAEREWGRFDTAPGGAANLAIHRSFLSDLIEPGWRVLEVGAGPGRFTIELARPDTRVATTDISCRQLDLNRENVSAAGAEDHVESRTQADLVDLPFDDHGFDAVVCFGGPLSYVLERADEAVAEMVRVTRPGGILLVSVMSLLGAARAHLPGVIELAHARGVEQVLDQVLTTGVLTADINDGHQLKLYRWAELVALLERHGCEVIDGATANHLTISHQITPGDEVHESLVDWEVRLSREPGIRDAGTHLLAAVRTPA